MSLGILRRSDSPRSSHFSKSGMANCLVGGSTPGGGAHGIIGHTALFVMGRLRPVLACGHGTGQGTRFGRIPNDISSKYLNYFLKKFSGMRCGMTHDVIG